MTKFDDIFFVIIIFTTIIIFVIAVIITIIVKKHKQDLENRDIPDSNYQINSWSSPEPSDDSTRNQCLLYNFPTTIINGNKQISVPTLNTSTLNQLTPSNLDNISCYYQDQIIAKQVKKTCTPVQNISDDKQSITICPSINGGYVDVGTTEVYYSDDCNIPKCEGKLSVIGINFHPFYNLVKCITSNHDGTTFMQDCDPTNDDQVFSIILQDLDNQLNDKGRVAKIFNRNLGKCLRISDSVTSTSYDVPGYDCNQDNTHSTIQLNNQNTIIFDDCDDYGFIWYLLPASIWSQTKDNNNSVNTPSQFVYIKNLSFDDIKSAIKSYDGYTYPASLIYYFADQNVKSLFYGGKDQKLVAADFVINQNSDIQNPNTINCSGGYTTSQYSDINSFNYTFLVPVCTEGDNKGSCVNF